MEEAKITTIDSFKNKISLKQIYLKDLKNFVEQINASLKDINNLDNNYFRCVFFTSLGTIEADISNKAESKDDLYKKTSDNEYSVNLSSIFLGLNEDLAKFEKELGKPFDIIDSTYALYLTDAEITYTNGTKVDIPQMVLFSDQIIGFAINNVKKK